MNKHFVFVDQGEWDCPPRDCCPPTYWESWLCSSHDVGSVSDMYEAYLFAIRFVTEDDTYQPQEQDDWELMENEVLAYSKQLGITVDMVYDNA